MVETAGTKSKSQKKKLKNENKSLKNTEPDSKTEKPEHKRKNSNEGIEMVESMLLTKADNDQEIEEETVDQAEDKEGAEKKKKNFKIGSKLKNLNPLKKLSKAKKEDVNRNESLEEEVKNDDQIETANDNDNEVQTVIQEKLEEEK